MLKYDLSRDQHLLQAQFGFDKPMGEFTKNFFVPGKVVRQLPLISVAPEYEALIVPNVALAGSKVPIIYRRGGYAHFGVAKWGTENQSLGRIDRFRQCANRTLGFPALIPVSYIDLAVGPEKAESDVYAVRLRPPDGENLYIGATFLPGPLDSAESVTPLICEPGPDIASHIDWQPLLMRVSEVPTMKNSDFIFRRDSGRLQMPSSRGSVEVELIRRLMP